MAAATILLRRSACVISASPFLSTAAKRSHLLIPTAISSLRRFSSAPVVNNIQTPSYDVNHVNNISQQSVDKDKLVRDILSQLGSMRDEIESLRKVNEELRESPEEKEVVAVKEKHPLLKEIEAAMSKAEISSRADLLPDGFEVECDKPGVAKVTLKKAYKKEIINIEVFTPSHYNIHYNYFEMDLIVKDSFSRIFSSTVAEFHCTARDGELEINKIKDPSDGPNCHGIDFELLPESLQTEFYNYLKIRGIDDETSHKLYKYMVDKMKRENMRGLGKFQKLVEEA